MYQLQVAVVGFLLVSLSKSTDPAVNLIVRSSKTVLSVVCPTIVMAQRRETIYRQGSNRIIKSQSDVKFNCRLLYNGTKEDSSTSYQVTLKPQVNSSLFGCKRLDECFALYLRQIQHEFVEVDIKSSIVCLLTTLIFKYELREGNQLISNGYINVCIGQKPDPPKYLKLERRYNKLFIKGVIQPICESDVTTSDYYMNYELHGFNCSQSNATTCQWYKVKEKYSVSCLLLNSCEDKSPCNIQIVAYIYGKNKFGVDGNQSGRFSKVMALTDAKALSINVIKRNLHSLTVSFKKPVNCTSTLSYFQYKVTYGKLSSNGHKISFVYSSCKVNLDCSIHLAGLLMNTHYNICVQYMAYFDYTSQYSQPYCVDAFTAKLPCHAPSIYDITPVHINKDFWKAVIDWNVLKKGCWGDGSKYYLLHLNNMNRSEISIKKSLLYNHSSQVVTYLYYGDKYSLMLSSCNTYGCLQGKIHYLFINKRQEEKGSNVSSSQTVAETVLICVLSILFLAVSFLLYCIVKRRKQMRPMSIQRLRANDIQMLNKDHSTDGFSTNYIAESKPLNPPFEEVQVIKVDTRPLAARKVTMCIPENSTLV